ncbi:MAG: metal-sulfur cluster assembly factor [Corynebacterium sp.]|nr:metal-sulfur cluster assembly factor [Corynebacterium sp.]
MSEHEPQPHEANAENTDEQVEDYNLEGEHQRPPQSDEDLARAADVEEFLRDVIDPELGINVVDLGLVYDIWIENETEAVVNMTLTSPACPLTDVLEDQAQAAVVGNGVATKLTIQWVWLPPWGPHMITEEGREMLRALGYSV